MAGLVGGGGTLPPRGFALVIVLWAIVLLALLATGVTAAGRSDLQIAGNIRRAAAAEAAADGGIAAAMFYAGDGAAVAWPVDGVPRRFRVGGYALTVRVLDESGKVNPNFAGPALLAALLVGGGSDPSRAATVAQSIARWGERGDRAATTERYRAAGLTAAPTGGPFRSVAELGLVIGMTPELLARIAPHLSVYATGEPNQAHADLAVQDALRSVGEGPPAGPAPRATVFEVTADARGDDGSRFIRHAIVGLSRIGDRRPFRTLVWDALPAD